MHYRFVLLGFTTIACFAQSTSVLGSQFEVVSIKPVDRSPGSVVQFGAKVYPGGRVVLGGYSLKTMIAAGYGISFWQISGGGEPWTENDTYNVDARPPEAMRSQIKDLRHTLFGIEDEHLRQMIQNMLADRFQLKFHWGRKAGDIYLLERNDKPIKLRRVDSEGNEQGPAPDTFGSIGFAGGKWNISASSMPQLAKFAADNIFHVPVLDRTGLSGSYEYRQPQPDLEPTYGGDSTNSFRSFLSNAGFKLEHSKGTVEYLIIDSAAKPLPN